MPAGTPKRGPAAEKGAESDADTGNAAEAPVEALGIGVSPSRPSNWEAMTRAQKMAWKKRGGKQRRCPGPCDQGGALLPPSLGAVAIIATAHGMAEAAEVGAAAVGEVMKPYGLSTAAGAPKLHVTPTHGPAVDKGANVTRTRGTHRRPWKLTITAVESGPIAA